MFGFSSAGNALVAGRVWPESAAERLGLRVGDVILEADGEAVSGRDEIPVLSEAREAAVLREAAGRRRGSEAGG